MKYESLAIVLCLASTGCVTPTPKGDQTPRERVAQREVTGEPIAVPDQFERGCSALQDTSTVRGKLRTVPFGKGADGVILDDGDVKWVISYEADGFFEDFDNERVIARGRECEKEGAAVSAPHFEVRSIRVIE